MALLVTGAGAPRPTAASAGEREPLFKLCAAGCAATGCARADARNTDSGGAGGGIEDEGGAPGERAAPGMEHFCEPACAPGGGGAGALPAHLRLTGWDCAAECDYRCMRARAAARAAAGKRAHKYHGKWAFVRLAGLQEPLSSAASVANLLAHALARRRWRPAERGGPYGALWMVYTAVHVNAWVWSTVFHARDTRATEAADYLSAAGSLFVSAACVAARTLAARTAAAQVRSSLPRLPAERGRAGGGQACARAGACARPCARADRARPAGGGESRRRWSPARWSPSPPTRGTCSSSSSTTAGT